MLNRLNLLARGGGDREGGRTAAGGTCARLPMSPCVSVPSGTTWSAGNGLPRDREFPWWRSDPSDFSSARMSVASALSQCQSYISDAPGRESVQTVCHQNNLYRESAWKFNRRAQFVRE